MKRLLRHPAVIAALSWLVAAYGRLVFATARIHVTSPLPPALQGKPVLFALWHHAFWAVPVIHARHKTPLLGLMSASRDGALTRTIAHHFGIGAIVGSSSRGAVSGARGLIRAARAGNSLFLTADGPRGPAQHAKPGATEIARLTRLPLIPCAAITTRGRTFGSWDSFRLPYPFSRIVLAYGEPLETLTPAALTATLNSLTAQAQAAALSCNSAGKHLG